MRRYLLLAGVVLPVLTGQAFAMATLPVGVAGDASGFAKAVQPPGLIDCYVDSRLPESQYVASASWAATSSCTKDTTPVVGLPMAAPGEDAGASFKAWANGSRDSIINGMIQAFADAGYKGMYLRPGFEMSGNWFQWSVTPANVADFVAAFQHIAALAHGFHGMLISVVWNPNVGNSAVSMNAQYPGDTATDIVGLDIYGAPIDNDAAPMDPSGSTTFTLAGTIAFAKAHQKPFALPETGGNSAAFVINLAESLAAADGVTIAFINVWNTDSQCGGCTIAVGSSQAKAWKSLIAQQEDRMAKTPVVGIALGGGGDVCYPSGDGGSPPPKVPAIPVDPQVAGLEAQLTELEAQVAAIPPVTQTQTPSGILDTSATQAFINNLNAWTGAAQADLAATTAAAKPPK